jgi:peptidoglycan/LPS O-acetylase OafA/YrhL
VRVLGLMTFSIYLWHMAIVERIMSLTDPPHDWPSAIVRLLMVFGLTLPFAAGSYLLVERPFMELRRRLERADVATSAG